MALNVRLSPALDTLAREYCERVGISLNSLVGVALDAYLRQSDRPAVTQPPEPPAPAAAVARPAPDPVLLQRHAELRQAFEDSKPSLPAKPSKADRRKLAEWHRRNPAG